MCSCSATSARHVQRYLHACHMPSHCQPAIAAANKRMNQPMEIRRLSSESYRLTIDYDVGLNSYRLSFALEKTRVYISLVKTLFSAILKHSSGPVTFVFKGPIHLHPVNFLSGLSHCTRKVVFMSNS